MWWELMVAETQAPTTGRATTVVWGFVIAIGLLLLVGVANLLYRAETNARQVTVEQDGTAANRLDVAGQILAVDLNRYEMTVRLSFTPVGNLIGPDRLTLTRDLRLFVNAASGTTERTFAKGRPIGPTDVVISLYDGETSDFPFDRHSADLTLYLTSGEEPIPMRLSFNGGAAGLVIDATDDATVTPGYVGLDLEVARSATTITFAIFIMIIQWALAIGLIVVVFSILFRGRKPEVGMFSWMGAMLFAFPALRNAAPGAPPIGAFSDYLAFFWVEAIVAICLILVVSVWLLRPAK